jgi:hypothetical protein
VEIGEFIYRPIASPPSGLTRETIVDYHIDGQSTIYRSLLKETMVSFSYVDLLEGGFTYVYINI